MLGRFGFFPWRSNQCVWLWWFSRGEFLICVRYHQCMRFQFQVIFLGWISYLCQMSSVLVISMTRIFIDHCCSRSIVADVSIRTIHWLQLYQCMCWLLSLDTNPYLHSGERCGVLGLAELPHRKGVWKYNWLRARSLVRCGICASSTLRMCFYARWISLISGLLNEDLICWDDSWNCRGYSVIGICFVFSLVDANSFVLVSGYFDIWNLFSLDAALFVAGICFSMVLHMDVAFPCEWTFCTNYIRCSWVW